MASNVTPEYGLNQWSLEDNFLMDEFNTDNRNIEQALVALKAALPKFQTGSYIGTGTYGEANPNVLNFSFDPQLVVVTPDDSGSSIPYMLCIQGAEHAAIPYDSRSYGSNYAVTSNCLVWGESSLQWYNPTYFSHITADGPQLNLKDKTYNWLAIG